MDVMVLAASAAAAGSARIAREVSIAVVKQQSQLAEAIVEMIEKAAPSHAGGSRRAVDIVA